MNVPGGGVQRVRIKAGERRGVDRHGPAVLRGTRRRLAAGPARPRRRRHAIPHELADDDTVRPHREHRPSITDRGHTRTAQSAARSRRAPSSATTSALITPIGARRAGLFGGRPESGDRGQVESRNPHMRACRTRRRLTVRLARRRFGRCRTHCLRGRQAPSSRCRRRSCDR